MTHNLDERRCRELFAESAVARLGTVTAAGAPQLVPVTFALLGSRIVFAVDHKPKTTTKLRRLTNIAARPAVSFLVDHYDDDWAELWWVRADAVAAVTDDDRERTQALDALVAKYPQYAAHRPAGPVVLATVTRWSGWAAAG